MISRSNVKNFGWLAVLMLGLLAIALTACSGDSEAEPGDGDVSSTPCTVDADCPADQVCGVNNYCVDYVPPTDGDGDTESPDGDTPTDGDGTVLVGCPETINFGAVQVGESVTQAVTVGSTGTLPLEIRTAEFAFVNEDFEILDTFDFPLDVSPGTTWTVNVRFTPSSNYSANQPLQIVSNAENEPLCTVLLQSELKGTSVLTLDPDEVGFGNVRVGDPASNQIILICNEGDGNKAIQIPGIGFKYPSSVPHFDFITDPLPDPNDPWLIRVDSCMELEVAYQPTEATTWPELHENAIIIQHNADTEPDDVKDGRAEIYLSGSADQDSVRIDPNPVQFGTVVIGDTVTSGQSGATGYDPPPAIVIQNQTGRDVEVQDIIRSGNHCEEFEILFGDSNPPFTLVKDEELEAIQVSYSPVNSGPDEYCDFKVIYQQGDRQGTSTTRLKGTGRPENIPPVARISNVNRQEITQPIYVAAGATENQRRFTFYGDTSYDEDDGTPLRYIWSLDKPSSSNASLQPPPTEDSISVTVTVDWAGAYNVNLKVKDTDNVESTTKSVFLNYQEQENIRIDMTFTGGGTMNVNLEWVTPNGTKCSDETMSSQRSCIMGGDYGVAYVSNYTSQYDNGSQETITHPNSPDGAYTIRAFFDEDCAGWNLDWICLDRRSSDVTVKIYINGEVEYRWIRNAHLSDQGNFAEWQINKASGTWSEPTP